AAAARAGAACDSARERASSTVPAMAAARHELAHLLLLLGLEAVVEVAESGDQLGAPGLDRARLGVDERLRLDAVECRSRDQRLHLGAWIAAADDCLALRAQLLGERGQLGALRRVEIEARADAIDHALAHARRVFLAHVLPIAVVSAVRARGQPAEQHR